MDLSRSFEGIPYRLIPPERYRRWTLADYSAQAVQRVYEWAAGPLWSLLLTGAPGTRKTSLAWALARQAGQVGYRSQVAMPQSTVEHVRQNHEWWIDQAKTIPLLVLDDLGAFRATPHVHETLILILTYRYDHCRKTIVTSNVSLEDLSAWLDPRVADRLREGVVISAGRESRRTTGNEAPSSSEAAAGQEIAPAGDRPVVKTEKAPPAGSQGPS